MNSLSDIWTICSFFQSVPYLFILLIWSLEGQIFKILMKYNFLNFFLSFMEDIFVSMAKNSSLHYGSQRFFSTFSSSNIIV